MLQNKVILITGASRGIGRAVAECYAANGAKVILLSRNIRDLTIVHDQIIANGDPQPAIYPFNLCSATLEDYDDLRRTIDTQYGKLDGLVHNAGILGALAPIEFYDIQKWYQVLQVNLNSAFILTQACMPLLKQAHSANVIFTIADVATDPKANWGAYAVANAGCLTMMRMLAAECEKITKIRVNAIKPRRIQTQLRATAYPAENTSGLYLPTEVATQYLKLMCNMDPSFTGKTLDAIPL
jgi:NAD(P)-dependent dehydrogenase (short-subunit alcohol dehydrogenase family)